LALGSLDRGGPGNDLLETQLSLDVYLSGKRIGTLWPNGGDELDPPGRSGCSFAYRPEVVEETAGARLLSYAMPVRAEPYGPRDTFPYLEGLLPQGKWRHLMAAELGIAPGDGYALIAALGRDCPGAVTFMPAGAAPGNHVGDTLAWLDADELEELVGAEEPERLLDPVREQRMRFALAGESYKLALIRDAQGGRWAWPEPGAPSTHIVKPQREDRPGSAVAELACTMALREMGLPIVHVEVDEIAGRTCLISKRFDRWGEGIGVERIHQESISQALGWGPGCPARGKRPGYAESRRLLKALGEEEGVRALFTIAYCRFLIGCREEGFGEDAALLYAGREPLLSPFFGITASLAYDPAASASLEELVFRNSCLARLARVAVECDYPFEAAVAAATEAIGGLCLALNGVAGRARSEGWYEPVIDEIRERVFEHMKSFRSEVHLFSPTSRGGSRRT
jgi:serine/threonine-protein kinase HipA